MKVIIPVTVTPAMVTSSSVGEPASGEAAWSAVTSYAVDDEVTSPSTHRTYVSLRGKSATVTISNASPAVVTRADHGLAAGQALTFTTTGALPTGLVAGQVYYVVNPSLGTFQVALTPTGTPINTSSAGSGVHTAVVSTNLNNPPETSPLYWRDKGPSRKMAPFDTSMSTKAIGPSPMTYALGLGEVVDSFAVLGMTGARELTVKMTAGATVLYDKTFPLDGTIVDDWYDWLYAPELTKARITAFDLPPHSGATTTFTLVGDGDIEVAAIVPGLQADIGRLQAGARKPIRDFSRKDFDDFGQEIIVKRPVSRQLNGNLQIDNPEVNRIDLLMEDLRATPAVWVGVENHEDLTEPLTIYGFLRTYEPEFTYPTVTIASLSIEGLSEK